VTTTLWPAACLGEGKDAIQICHRNKKYSIPRD